MKKIFPLFAIAFMLLACGFFTQPQSGNKADTPAVSEKATLPPEPVYTQTNIPFAAMHLEDQMIVAGDLPATYSGTEIKYDWDSLWEGASKPDYLIFQRLSQGGWDGGSATVMLYEDEDLVNVAFDQIIENMSLSDYTDAGVGEKSVISSFPIMSSFWTNLVFSRCHAVAYLNIKGPENSIDVTIAYGKKLDSRLQAIACRP